MTQTQPELETALRVRDHRRADSDRVVRKFALSAAIQSQPGATPTEVVNAAKLFADYLLDAETG